MNGVAAARRDEIAVDVTGAGSIRYYGFQHGSGDAESY